MIGLFLIFLLFILLFIGFLLLKEKEIFSILLYFFTAISIINLILITYFISYIRYSNIIDMGFVLLLMNFIILIGFLFEKRNGDINK